MDFDSAARLVRLRERVRWGTLEALKADGIHKSDEAHVELSYVLPGMFCDDQRPYWTVSVYSYVLGPRRNHVWQGVTTSEALALAERDVATWVAKYEMAAFERAMMAPDAEDDEHCRPAKRLPDGQAMDHSAEDDDISF